MSLKSKIRSQLDSCLKANVNQLDLSSPVAERDDLANLEAGKGKAAAKAARDLIGLIDKHIGGDAIALSTAHFQIILHAQKFAHWMLARCGEGLTPQSAVEEFDKFLRRRKLTGKLISVLGYAEIDGPVNLSTGISIIPAQALAPEVQRMGGLWSPLRAFPIAGMNAPCLVKQVSLPCKRTVLSDKVQARLLRQIGKRTAKQTKQAVAKQRKLEEKVVEPFREEHDELDAVRHVLSLCGPRPLIEHGFWIEWDKGASPLWYFEEEPRLQRHEYRLGAGSQKSPIAAKEAKTLLEEYFKLSDEERRALRVPLTRLNQSMRRVDIVDRAIDLGIALESVILSGKDDSNVTSEITYRLSHRGAGFIAKDVQARKKTFHLLKAVYGLRSIAAHTGVVSKPAKSGGITWQPEDALSEAQKVCAQILTRCIMDGGRPDDWNIFIFGPEPEEKN